MNKQLRTMLKTITEDTILTAQKKVENKFYIITLQDYRVKVMYELLPELENENFGEVSVSANTIFNKMIPTTITKEDIKSNYKKISKTQYGSYNENINKVDLENKVNNMNQTKVLPSGKEIPNMEYRKLKEFKEGLIG